MDERSTDAGDEPKRPRRVVRIEVDGRDIRELANKAREAARGIRAEGRRLGRTLADPVRLQIFELLAEEERTVKDIADRVGMAPDRLYYHLNLLEEAGVIRIAEYRPERVYALCEDQHATSPQDVADLIGTVLDATTTELRQVLRRGAEARARGERQEKLQAAIGRSSVDLTTEEFRQLMEEATELINNAVERARSASTASRASKGRRRQFRVVFAAYETVPDEDDQ
jgi:DNA-binding transcriptional ArsR family regulator